MAGWAGKCGSGPATGNPLFSRKVLFLGAGFTRSIDRGAPLFGELATRAQAVLQDAGDPIPYRSLAWDFPDRLFERFEQNFGRSRLAESVFKWPSESHPLARIIGIYSLPEVWKNPSSPLRRRYFAWMLFEDYLQHLAQSYPQHVPAVAPLSPPVMLARLLREGILKTIVSTNWDAPVEIGCHATGLLINSHLNHGIPADVPGGDTVTVRSPLDLYHEGHQDDSIEILKVNGCFQHIAEAYRINDEKRREELLGYALAITVMDLDSWDGPSWVASAVQEALRGARVLFVGASGHDQVTYRVVRRIIHDRWKLSQVRASLNSCRGGNGPVIYGLQYSDGESSVRLQSMLHPEPMWSLGMLPVAHVRQGQLFWCLLYAWVLVNKLLEAVTGLSGLQGLSALLEHHWLGIVDATASVLKRTDEGHPAALLGSEKWTGLEILVKLVPRWMTLSQQGQGIPKVVFKGVHVHEEWPTFYLPFLRCDNERAPLPAGIGQRLLPSLAALVAILLASVGHEQCKLTVDGDDLQIIDLTCPGTSTPGAPLTRLLRCLFPPEVSPILGADSPMPPVLLRAVLTPVDPLHQFRWRSVPTLVRFNRCYGVPLVLHIHRDDPSPRGKTVHLRYWNSKPFMVCELGVQEFLRLAKEVLS